MWHSLLNDMEIPELKRFIPRGSSVTSLLQGSENVPVIGSIALPPNIIDLAKFCERKYFNVSTGITKVLWHPAPTSRLNH